MLQPQTINTTLMKNLYEWQELKDTKKFQFWNIVLLDESRWMKVDYVDPLLNICMAITIVYISPNVIYSTKLILFNIICNK
jgi:hypothetical protein